MLNKKNILQQNVISKLDFKANQYNRSSLCIEAWNLVNRCATLGPVSTRPFGMPDFFQSM